MAEPFNSPGSAGARASEFRALGNLVRLLQLKAGVKPGEFAQAWSALDKVCNRFMEGRSIPDLEEEAAVLIRQALRHGRPV